MQNNVRKYLVQQVMTASPAKLVFMLYDKAIASLREAMMAIEAGDIEARWRANNRATEIISHLWTTLDMENGCEIAENLDRLFPFIMRQLTQIDLQNDPAPAKEVIAILEPLRDSWRDLAMGVAKNAAIPDPARTTDAAAAPCTADVAAPPLRTSISV